ncbi:hypothetical protein [Kitasatospora fiedleri]|uniref:hypothetical protein n=1 Tax=Kitasatospora fiedleri TaxID=2991545 RepID=UPI00249B36FC|nr:hypothetical protein [Kitasatospora fiedleri]
MHPWIIAGVLERATASSIGAEACISAYGSPNLQTTLETYARRALAERHIDPREPSDGELRAVAAHLRATSRPPVADPAAIGRVLAGAAHWLAARPYGPDVLARADGTQLAHALNHTVLAVSEAAVGDWRLCHDALAVISQHLPVPHVTITNWEYNHNPALLPGVLALLRGLIADAAVPSYTPLPTEPRPDREPPRIDLSELAPLAVAARTGQAVPDNPAERRTLTRTWQATAAHAADTDPGLAAHCQAMADALRARQA